MILTDRYLWVKLDDVTKSRLVCVASTRSYELFEEKRSQKHIKASSNRAETKIGDLIVYYSRTDGVVSADAHRKADCGLTMKGKHLSSIYTPDVQLPYGYGDVQGTDDALLFVNNITVIDGKVIQGSSIDVFVARGMAKNSLQLYQMFADGQLDDEMDVLIKKAKNHV